MQLRNPSFVFAITPGVQPTQRAHAFYVEGAGTIIVKDITGANTTINVAAFSYHPWEVTKIESGSTATGILGLRYD